MKIVPLTQGKHATVDDQDYDEIRRFYWQAQNIKRGWIVKRGVRDPITKNNRSQPLSNFILGAAAGVRIDHVNGDPFDNRRNNLRLCTKTQNDRAYRRKAANKTSQYRGVCRRKGRSSWGASIYTAGRQYHLGSFDQEEAAARAYDAAALKMFGEFAAPNFPVK